MRTIGVTVAVSRQHPQAAVVVLEGDAHAPGVVETFDFTTTEDDAVSQAHDLAKALSNRLRGLHPDSVVIRRADVPPRATMQESRLLRLIVEGALSSASKELVPNTRLLSGRDLGRLASLSKDELDARGGSLAAGRYAQAAAAAFAALF